jgi:hypothetical protein
VPLQKLFRDHPQKPDGFIGKQIVELREDLR